MLLFVFAFAFAFASVLLLCFLTLTNKRFFTIAFIKLLFYCCCLFCDYSYFFVNVSQLLSVTLYFLYLLFWCLIDYFSPLLLQFLFLLLLLLANASSVFCLFCNKMICLALIVNHFEVVDLLSPLSLIAFYLSFVSVGTKLNKIK